MKWPVCLSVSLSRKQCSVCWGGGKVTGLVKFTDAWRKEKEKEENNKKKVKMNSCNFEHDITPTPSFTSSVSIYSFKDQDQSVFVWSTANHRTCWVLVYSKRRQDVAVICLLVLTAAAVYCWACGFVMDPVYWSCFDQRWRINTHKTESGRAT